MKLKELISPGITIAALIFVCWYVRSHWEDFDAIRLVNGWYIVALAGLVGVRMTLRGLFQWQAIRSVGARVGFCEVLRLNFAGLMMNLLLPLPIGSGYRAVYFRRVHELPYNLFASTAAALFVYFLVVSSALGLLAIGWLSSQGKPVSLPAIGVLALVLGLGLIVFFLPSSIGTKNPLTRRISRILEGWHAILGSPRLIISAIMIVFMSMVISVLAMFIAFRVFGVRVDASEALVLMSSQRVGSLIRITPGAVGFQEMVSVYFAKMLTVSAAETLVALGMMRLIGIAMSLLLGIPSMWMTSMTPKSPEEPTEIDQ